MTDVNTIRNPDILLHDLQRADEVYTIYYDDTNNIKRLHITPNGLNVRDPGCFVLGGIAHLGAAPQIDVTSLRSLLAVQKSAHELKLKHVAKGDLLQILESNKTQVFLRWFTDTGLFLQFQVLDPVYWSIADIIDSIVGASGSKELLLAAPMLKSDLHTVIKHDLDWPVDLFRRHSYPAVSDSRRVDLLRELNDIVRVRSGLLPHYNHKMLEGILRMAERWEGLPFLESEAPHVLIDEFSMFYIKRICLFKNSAHIFDAEDTIRARLSAEPLLDDGRPLRNFRFADSKSAPGIQIADVVTGLLGKFFTFVSRTPPEELQDLLSHPSANQSQNLALLANLVERSIAENAAFASYVMSNDDRHGCAILLGG